MGGVPSLQGGYPHPLNEIFEQQVCLHAIGYCTYYLIR